MISIPFNKAQLWLQSIGITAFILYIAYRYASDVFGLLPVIGDGGSAVFRSAGLFLSIMYIAFLKRYYQMLFHDGPAVVLDNEGIRVFPWNKNQVLKWPDIAYVKLTDWGLSINKGRGYRYLTLEGKEGQKLKIESHIIKRDHWQAIYQHVLKSAPPDAVKDLLSSGAVAGEV